ncbi:hypothetical protein E2C01_079159 [Portunus trituberculatus]|uniref:Uncharacterized protein n=1 Tax=Portunus trituberculatus TaxID=210409 RepID=A0A5B7IG88_PORTR|nr:hypothetical protein [Portunus trituberculatus]
MPLIASTHAALDLARTILHPVSKSEATEAVVFLLHQFHAIPHIHVQESPTVSHLMVFLADRARFTLHLCRGRGGESYSLSRG